jgi:hypothetical protein
MYLQRKGTMEEFFTELFQEVDKKLSELDENSDETGATACMIFITEEEGTKKLYM